MDRDVFLDLASHFRYTASLLKSEADAAAILDNPTDTGTARESVYLKFLKRYLPATCDIFLGGYIFDREGNYSRQTDIIVTGGPTPRYKLSSGDKHIAPLEGTIAVAEIKSRLDKKEVIS